MKTAHEWIGPLNDNGNSWTEVIKAIQADAYRAGLLRAAQVCRDVYRATDKFAYSDMCARAIEAEAQKGQP